MTPAQAAEQLGISYRTVLYHIRIGHLPATRIGHSWQIDPAALAEFQASYQPQAGRGGRPAGDGLTDRERGSRHIYVGPTDIYLGQTVGLDDVAYIRQQLPARLRGVLLLWLARLAEREPGRFEELLRELEDK